MALLVLAFAGLNIRVDSGTNDTVFGAKRFAPHAVQLFDGGGKLSFHMDTLRVAARSMLVDVPSCRRRTVSGSLDRLSFERRGEVAALTRKMERQDRAIAALRQKLGEAAWRQAA